MRSTYIVFTFFSGRSRRKLKVSDGVTIRELSRIEDFCHQKILEIGKKKHEKRKKMRWSMAINSRQKGARYERELAADFRTEGYDARIFGKRDKKTGRFAENKNFYLEKGNKIFVFLEDGKLLFFTDLNKRELVKSKSWSKHANGYAACRINGKEVAAHRFLINAPQGTIVDHINRNKKDNRLINLRITNKSVNAFNTNERINNKSGKTGVYYRGDTKKWTAEIKKDGHKYCLGCFDAFQKAVEARANAEVELYGFKQQR